MARDTTLTKCIDTSPSATASSAQAPMRPRWCELLRAGDADGHGLGTDHLAEAGVAIEPQHGPGIHHRLHVRVGVQPAFEIGRGIARQHADAVRIVAGEVGLDQVGGHRVHLVRLAAEAAHHQAHGGLQLVDGDGVGEAHGRLSRRRV
jgi:hypothetical protein